MNELEKGSSDSVKRLEVARRKRLVPGENESNLTRVRYSSVVTSTPDHSRINNNSSLLGLKNVKKVKL